MPSYKSWTVALQLADTHNLRRIGEGFCARAASTSDRLPAHAALVFRSAEPAAYFASMTSLHKFSMHKPHFHRQDDPAMAGAAEVLGDDEEADIPIVERARAEDAKLRKMFKLMEDEGVVNEFVCGASAICLYCESSAPLRPVCDWHLPHA